MSAAPAASAAPVEFEAGPIGAPTVVLVHGLGASWSTFAPILPLLAEHVRVLAIDLPGFGARAPERGIAPGVTGYADWLERDLARRGVVAAHLVGSSMGGAVALELARRGRAASATAFAPVGFWRTPGRLWCQGLLSVLRAFAARGAAPASRLLRTRGGRAVLLAPLFARPVQVTPEAAIDDLHALAAAPSFAAARRSFRTQAPVIVPARVPVTIAWGDRDAVLPGWSQARRARRLLPSATHVRLHRAGHLPFADDPHACAAVILRRVAARASAGATTERPMTERQTTDPTTAPTQTGAAA